MSYQQILESLKKDHVSGNDIFEAIYYAEQRLLEYGREDNEALEIAIRLLDSKNRGLTDDSASEVISFLVRDCGLFPYATTKSELTVQAALMSAHTVHLSEPIILHSKQMEILLELLQGKSVILSAPTSFGKSLIVDAYINKSTPNTIVMIVPTIALIDETRRRLQRNFRGEYQVITQRNQERRPLSKAAYVLTQERLLERTDISTIDLLFVDEFYKLDPSRDDDRSDALNIAIYQNIPKSKQVLMAGPHVSSITLNQKWTEKFRFFRTDYRTVSVNIIDRSGSKSHLDIFLKDLASVGRNASLIFTSHPGSAMQLLAQIVAAKLRYKTSKSTLLGNWIAENYHPSWLLAKAVEYGIAVHHGKIPRSLAQLFVRQFDSGNLKVLICTSTLIEGVNTSAANVFIYDKKINRTDFDFFSFANIRGRVGRMMRHFVGNAFLYHQPPAEVSTKVEIPILSDPSSSSEYIILNVDEKDLRPSAFDRSEQMIDTFRLPKELLARYGSLGLERIMLASDRVSEVAKDHPSLVVWTGFPSKDQRLFLCEIALHFFAQPKRQSLGARTPPQLAWCLAQLRLTKSLPKYLRWFAERINDGSIDDGIERAFQFLNGCEYLMPQVFSLVQDMVKHYLPDENVNYGLYISGVENLFRPSWIRSLDEIGIPFPLGERLIAHIPSESSLDQAIALLSAALAGGKLKKLNDMDRTIISSALVII